jgi:hypothetical protein
MGRIILFLVVFVTFGCEKYELQPPPVVTVGKQTFTNYDVFNGANFTSTNTYGNKSHSAVVVNKSNGYPVYDGNESIRFEVRDGDCGWNDGFSDCQTDRSRSEIHSMDFEEYNLGRIITYTTHVYIPKQYKFRPSGTNNLLVMNQVNYLDSLGKVFGALTYLVMENDNTLLIRTHKNFTWVGLNDYTITNTPYDKWITLKYVIKMSDNEDGYIKVYVDEKLLFNENRPTIPSKTGLINFKMGIYNSFRSSSKEPYSTQIMYVDGFSKKID